MGLVDPEGPYCGNYITAADPYYRYWVGTEDGVSTTVDGTYHLCRGDPTTCQGGPGSAQVVHLGDLACLVRG